MAKRIMAKTGTYQKDGEEKGEYVKVGVILSSQHGEYVLLDPAVNIAGIAYKQRVNGLANQGSDTVIASIFDDAQQQGGAQQQQGGQQQGGAKQQGGYQQSNQGQQQNDSQGFGQNIPFLGLGK